MKYLITILTALTLTGCSTIGGIDATTVLGTSLFKNAITQDQTVTVADFRKHDVTENTVLDSKSGTIVEIENDGFKSEGHNWNNDNDPNTVNEPVVTNQPSTVIPHPHPQSTVSNDRSLTLAWFFFAMMLMGMLGAGIIGLIEAISGRNSLDTTPSDPPPTPKPRKPRAPNKKTQTKK